MANPISDPAQNEPSRESNPGSYRVGRSKNKRCRSHRLGALGERIGVAMIVSLIVPVAPGAIAAAPSESAPPLTSLLVVPKVPPLGPAADYLPRVQTHLELRLGERRVYVYRRGQVIASYPVAIGREGWETPTGKFKVMQAIKNPTWRHPFTDAIVPPGKDNPLGDRWIGFWTDGTNSIGFHGTPHPELIGQAVSHGCVRMTNEDVSTLFEQVEVGMMVIVKP